MKKIAGAVLLFILLCAGLTLSGVGSKEVSVCAVYATTAALSLAAVISYCFLIRKKDPWFTLLFSSIFVVNTGYLALALSQTLPAALWANRLAYLGSVFLPPAMLMIILNTCKIRFSWALPKALIAIGAVVFLIAGSPGVLDIYYKEVSLSVINGATVLEKTYGPFHCLYLFYLLAYFVSTAAVLFHACVTRHVDSAIHAVFLSAAVFVNMGVWLLEQIVRIDFELLSVSYIVSELLLLLLCLLIQTDEKTATPIPAAAAHTDPATPPAETDRTLEDKCAYLAAQRASLTPTERTIYGFYLEGRTTKEIMAELNIKENTLKYHNKNIYGKLGVSSRKELVTIASMLPDDE